MKNMNYLVAAYVSLWAIFCVYLLSVAHRVSRLQEDVKRWREEGK